MRVGDDRSSYPRGRGQHRFGTRGIAEDRSGCVRERGWIFGTYASNEEASQPGGDQAHGREPPGVIEGRESVQQRWCADNRRHDHAECRADVGEPCAEQRG
jgi:hypothetical protein